MLILLSRVFDKVRGGREVPWGNKSRANFWFYPSRLLAYHAKKFPDKAKDPAWLEDVVFGTGAGVGGGIIEGADIDL